MTPPAIHETDTTTNAPTLDDRLDGFMALSSHLLSLIQHENAILAETGELTFEHYIQKKVAKMREFENQAQNLLQDVIDGGAGTARSRILMEEVRRIRDALTVNSAYQIDQIRNRTQSRQDRFDQEKFAARSIETCH